MTFITPTKYVKILEGHGEVNILQFNKEFYCIRENEPKMELLRQFKILLEKKYKEYHKVSDYANLLNKSPKTITNQFKLLGQESPSVLIQQRIIIEAKRYLISSSLSIKEIVFNLGFDDAPSFSHYFKSKTTFAPKYLMTLCNNCDDLIAFNLGAAFSNNFDKWAVRPEYGLLFNLGESGHFAHFSLGFSFNLSKE
ncbi:MAG: AraC-like DNA-binding protein [Saprospiraceae bacterium]|jgi:AraC-like DNA-binding protein